MLNRPQNMQMLGACEKAYSNKNPVVLFKTLGKGISGTIAPPQALSNEEISKELGEKSCIKK